MDLAQQSIALTISLHKKTSISSRLSRFGTSIKTSFSRDTFTPGPSDHAKIPNMRGRKQIGFTKTKRPDSPFDEVIRSITPGSDKYSSSVTSLNRKGSAKFSAVPRFECRLNGYASPADYNFSVDLSDKKQCEFK